MPTLQNRQVNRDLDPIDVETIGDSTDSALGMRLGTSTRVAIDAKTITIVGHLQLLVSEELGADQDPVVRGLYRDAYGLLDLQRRPRPDASAFQAFFYLREVATLSRRLLWIYAGARGVAMNVDVPR
ncbi:hypothetical protein M1P56_09720 [Streptomyces sp. HU2014]|uniref:hypothetical protein n=1 Tax=Streptomyces sp. HU2014 TaxID=2939414 RepID=UPI00200DDB7D|nr:hypothetical protein [Streptomyces sp. HU2014]UQI44603.1 hypothetical protein M1P56_09720 [Streptomyces sp. HU2014]